jgi:1-acyl-sn-glycerol-3-phosphate acyltransferase
MIAASPTNLIESRASVAIDRPDLLADPKGQLSRIERIQIAAIRRTFEPGSLNDAIRWCQHTIGCWWITTVTDNLRHVHGVERVPDLDPAQSFILASNHRSFFDLYVVVGDMVKRGLRHRLMFPVRSEFFYDRPLGFFVNGVMSFFAMYPPIFRERKRAALNLVGLDETVWMLKRGGCFLGIHPEGRRNLTDDPYTLLPAQPGVGQIALRAKPIIVPLFINGVTNDFAGEFVRSQRRGTHRSHPVILSFGAPIDYSDLTQRPPRIALYKKASDRINDSITALMPRERALRAQVLAGDIADDDPRWLHPGNGR